MRIYFVMYAITLSIGAVIGFVGGKLEKKNKEKTNKYKHKSDND